MASPDTFKLNLRGFASISHLAERAWVKLAAITSNDDKQITTDTVLTTAQHIEAEIRDTMSKFKVVHGEPKSPPISHWNRTPMTTMSYMQNTRRRYTARIDFDIRLRDFNALADLTARLSSLDHCEIDSVDWRLTAATRKSLESRLRIEAAADALARAKDYCAVFCPGVTSIRITPDEIGNENSVNSPNMFINSSNQLSSPGPMIFTPRECRMDLYVQVQFQVETSGFDIQLTQPQTVVIDND